MSKKTIKRTGPDLGLPHHAIAYVRVSTNKQGESGLSLEDQERDCKRYARGKGLRIVETMTDVCSASVPFGEREWGARALEMLRLRKANHLVIKKIDRVFRSLRDMVNTMQLLATYKVSLHVAEHSMDWGSPQGKLLLGILTTFAEYEREICAERTRAAKAAARARGDYLGGIRPYGFRLGERQVIERMRELRKHGLSYRKVAEALTEEGTFNRNGNPFDYGQVRRLLLRVGLDGPLG